MNISGAQWRVMEVVWRGSPVTAAEVIAELEGETQWSHRTIRTLLARLVEKDALAAEADGKRYRYRARVGRNKCVRAEGRSFLDKVFAGDAAELLVHFVRDAQITPEQIDELKELLDEKREEAEG